MKLIVGNDGLPFKIPSNQNDVKLGFTDNSPSLVHQVNENRYKVHDWCTAVLKKVEDCSLFSRKEKNVIVIFSSLTLLSFVLIQFSLIKYKKELLSNDDFESNLL